jgi:Dehydrogenases with different specificities (related to short-chain alcohol dehydrogenases)
MSSLNGKIAFVTGATRGIGKGIVIALAKAGACVYFTGRTIDEGKGAVSLAGSLTQTEKEARQYHKEVYAIKCDHTIDEETQAAVRRIIDEKGRIDILVNNVWGGYECFNDGTQFWLEREFYTIPVRRWDKMFHAGIRAHYVTSSFVAPIMAEQGSGLIINISFWAAQRNDMGVAYGIAKAADDKMVETMAYELQKYNINVISLYPGLVRTESVMAAAQYLNLENSESPEFIGRVIAGMMDDEKISEKSGTIQIAASLALEYGITDIDGSQPQPLTIDTCKL